MTRVSTRIEGLRVLLVNALQGAPWRPEPVAVRLEREATDRTILFEGTVPGVVGNKIITVTASRLKDRDLLASWVRLAALTLHDPTQSWQSVTIGRSPKDDKLAVQRLSLRSKADAEIILGFMTDFWERSRSDAVPFFPSTSRAVHDGDWKEARSAWDTNRNSGERSDRWANLLFDVDFDELRKIPLSDDESPIGDGYGGRLAYWSHRVWGTFAETTVVEETIHKISDVLAGSVGATADDDEDGSQ
jgi:exonuclease V gamma subunit